MDALTCLMEDYFNPRPREGGDRSATVRAVEYCDFNPRPREGGDIEHGHHAPAVQNFNPRPREGGDHRILWQ